jgi:hypothetical protein
VTNTCLGRAWLWRLRHDSPIGKPQGAALSALDEFVLKDLLDHSALGSRTVLGPDCRRKLNSPINGMWVGWVVSMDGNDHVAPFASVGGTLFLCAETCPPGMNIFAPAGSLGCP